MWLNYTSVSKVNTVIKTILLAIDLTVFTPCLLQHGGELAKKHDAKLIVVHAIEPLGMLGHALINAYLDPDKSREITTKGLASMVSEVKVQVIDALTDEFIDGSIDLLQLGEVIVKTGAPEVVILEAARAIDASLIMLGSNSPDLDKPSTLGSVSQKVLSRSKIPVFMIPNSPLVLHRSQAQSQLGLW
ncbi:MAG: nucleotide-binding universal stress UspA family protein [Pseudohongiellaceae bacterium]|jgi:nucleotide-binding universal stress UspA family protein